jgi:NAD(P)-dependent dehydrogenase (short-subunit alcohol dehydrogenase family)
MSVDPAVQRFSLAGKLAVVTGGSRGIGRGIALGLAQHGADVGIVYHQAAPKFEDPQDAAVPPADSHNNAAQAGELAAQIRLLGRQAYTWGAELGDTEALPALAERLWADCGRIDILVNNAGMAYFEPFNEITPQHWRRLMAVNCDAVFFLTQAVAERMIAAGIAGRIINISSKNGFVAEAGLAHYNASKGAVELLSQSLAIELGAHGITVNTIAPGIIETEIAGDFELAPGFFAHYRQHIPLQGRFGTVEDIVGAAVFLASRAGAYMNGQHLIIDGGVLCDQVPRLAFMTPYKNSL